MNLSLARTRICMGGVKTRQFLSPNVGPGRENRINQ